MDAKFLRLQTTKMKHRDIQRVCPGRIAHLNWDK